MSDSVICVGNLSARGRDANLLRLRVLYSDISQGDQRAILHEIIRLAQLKAGHYVCFANVHMLIEAYHSLAFRSILNGATVVSPDGMPVSLLMSWLYHVPQKRLSGPDLMPALFEQASREGLSVFFYGSTNDVLESMVERLSVEFPDLKVVGSVSPPFRRLTEAEDLELISRINCSGASIVFVCLGCPKQEVWMAEHQHQIKAVMVGVGAAFSFYSGHLNRAPKWMQNFCLEWLFRFLMEPKRLFIRYFYTNVLFIILASCQLLFNKTSKG